MAYGKRFISSFKNIKQDIFTTNIWQKDFVGDPVELTGAETPLSLSRQDADILEPVQPTSITINFLSKGQFVQYYVGVADIEIISSLHQIKLYAQSTALRLTPGKIITILDTDYHITNVLYDSLTDILTLVVSEDLTDASLTAQAFTLEMALSSETFYSDDDQEYIVEITDANETILFTGFLVQDEAGELETDTPHVLTLKATDNLALLSNYKLNEVMASIPVKASLFDVICACLSATGLFSLTEDKPRNLPIVAAINVFENSMDDRSDVATFNILENVFVTTNIYKKTETEYDDCLTIISGILRNLNATISLVNSIWYVVRPNEFFYFGSNIPATKYDYVSGSTPTISTDVLGAERTIAHLGGDLWPVNEDMLRTIARPLKNATLTFNYEQPPYIDNAALWLPNDAIPYTYVTIDGVRYENYNPVLYFPSWKSRGTILGYLQKAIDVVTETELERYMVIPGPSNSERAGLQFNPIEVTKGDTFDLSFDFKTNADVSDPRIWVRFNLIKSDGTYYTNTYDLLPDAAFRWDGTYDGEFWDENSGVPISFTTDNLDTSKSWLNYNLKSFYSYIPPVPEDGVLLVQILGTNVGGDDRRDVYVKNIQFTIKQSINNSIYISGEKHTNTFNDAIKKTQEDEIKYADTVRNTIAGTLFTNQLTNFDLTDSSTGAETLIGNRAFFRTKEWHIGNNAEALKLGNIIARERLQLLYTSRLMREGTYRANHVDFNLNQLSPVNIEWHPDKKFLWRGYNIDFKSSSINGRLQELYNNVEDEFIDNYKFSLIYNVEAK